MLLKLLNFYFSTSTLGVVLPDQVTILFPLFYICMLFTLFQRNLLRYCQNQSTHSHRNLIFFLVKTATYFSKLINSDLEICTALTHYYSNSPVSSIFSVTIAAFSTRDAPSHIIQETVTGRQQPFLADTDASTL